MDEGDEQRVDEKPAETHSGKGRFISRYPVVTLNSYTHKNHPHKSYENTGSGMQTGRIIKGIDSYAQ